MNEYITPDFQELRDHVAEQQLIAIALSGQAMPDAMRALPVQAFTAWHCQDIATAIYDLDARSLPTDAAVVAREVIARCGTDDRARQLGKMIADLAGHPVPASSAGYYAERLASLFAARKAVAAAGSFQHMVAYAAEHDDPDSWGKALASMQENLDGARDALRPVAPRPPMSLGELLDSPDDPYDWLVPNLLERTDRLIVTGFEGHGKSMLLAQFALTIAAGLHPFSGDPLPCGPQRVLIFDAENSRRQMRRRYRGMRWQIERRLRRYSLPEVDWPGHVRIVSRPEGVALSDARELARIEQSISASSPDLVVAGPLYKLAAEDIRDEQAAKELLNTLDGLRIRHQFTLICEAHAGHANDGGGNRRVRPIGSSVFLRWPEFGFGIAPTGDAEAEEHPSEVVIKHWRGSREERHWPVTLCHGTGPGDLPWKPSNADYWDLPTERGAA